MTDTLTKRQIQRNQNKAEWERAWLTPPTENALDRKRRDLALKCISPLLKNEIAVVDIGCGEGCFAKVMQKLGADVTAVDVAENALKHLPESIRKVEGNAPYTTLADDAYDVVTALDLIAEISTRERRLFVSEMARLVKRSGHVLCSTPVDMRSEDAVERFFDLMETEFIIDQIICSHLRLWIAGRDFWKAPRRFQRAGRDRKYRRENIERRFGLRSWWFQLNSCRLLAWGWGWCAPLSDRIAHLWEESDRLLNRLEKLGKALFQDSGITHVMVLGHQRPLYEPPEVPPQERPKKKSVWE